ncbi:MAG: hypothetical protein KAS93_03040 [Gammaproteobacteria bacterium]|nr:hypothetical protein [Gammaproteobacteria bacterium]
MAECDISKICSGFILVVLNVAALCFAVFQAIFMESPWVWFTIAITALSVILSNTFLLNKICTMLLARTRYNPNRLVDLSIRQLFCCAVVIEALFSFASLFFYVFCSSKILSCPGGVTAGSITCAILLTPIFYALAHCMCHKKFNRHKAKKMLGYKDEKIENVISRQNKVETAYDNDQLQSREVNREDNVATSNRKGRLHSYMQQRLVQSRLVLEEMDAKNSCLAGECSLNEHEPLIREREAASDAELHSTSAIIKQLRNEGDSGEGIEASTDLAIEEAYQEQHSFMYAVYEWRHIFWKVVGAITQTLRTQQLDSSEANQYITSAPQ